MNHNPELWGRPRDDVYGRYNHGYLQTTGPVSHTQQPIVTGSSVVAVKYKDGVVIAADNLASYGSRAGFPNTHRLHKYNNRIMLGFSGDVSDMQAIQRKLDALDIRQGYLEEPTSETTSDGTAFAPHELNARNLHMRLSKMMYGRRSELNPLWNAILIAGLDEEEQPFLASVDLLGTTFTSPTIASGFGAHLAVPILRRKVPDENAAKALGREEAVELIKECMKVLFYRDARSLDVYSIAVVENGKKVELKTEEKLEGQSWAFAEQIRGYGTQNV